jgi:hypothetical protein
LIEDIGSQFGKTQAGSDLFWEMLAPEPEEIGQVMESAMTAREKHPPNKS